MIRRFCSAFGAVLVTTVVAVCIPLLAPSAAGAGEFTILLCGESGGWVKQPVQEPSALGWSLKDDCSDRTWPHLSVEGAGELYGRGSWEFYFPHVKLNSITASVIGDPTATDIKYAMKLCPSVSPLNCDGPTLPWVYTFDPSRPDRIDFDSTDPLMPTFVTGVRIEASCERAEGETCAPPLDTPCADPDDQDCRPTPEFGLAGIVAKISDSTAPTLRTPDSVQTGDIGGDGWNNADSSIALYAQDSGSGIVHLEIETTNAPYGSSQYMRKLSGCTTVSMPSRFSKMCIPSWNKRIRIKDDPEFWKQGRNSIKVRAYDMARNFSALHTVQFDLDTVAPKAPEYLAVSGSVEPGNPWIATKSSLISWSPPANDYGSPLDVVRIDLQPVDAGTANATSFELTGSPAPTQEIISWPTSGRWKVSVRYRDMAGNLGAAFERVVDVDYTIPDASNLALPAWIGIDRMNDPEAVTWSVPGNVAALRSGLSRYEMQVFQADELSPAPVSVYDRDVFSAPLPANLTDGPWKIRHRAVSRAGLASSWTTVGFGVDLLPPTVDVDHAGDYWLSPHEVLTIFGRDAGGSGLDRIEYSDGSNKAIVLSESVDLAEIPEGPHTIEYRSVDRAQNHSVVRKIEFGVDRSPPIGRIRIADPATPLRVQADVSDGLSGIARAELQYKPVDTSVWQRLGEPFVAASTDVQAASLVSALPDTDLPDGEYEFRLLVVDVLGNSDTIDADTDGHPARRALPLRVLPTIAFGAVANQICNGAGRKRRCHRPPSVEFLKTDFSRKVTVEGRLALPDGRPLAGRSLELIRRNEFSNKRETIAAVLTGTNGEFSATLPEGFNREIVARFSGDDLNRPCSSAAVTIKVPARLTFRANRRTIRPRRRIVFSGRLILGGAKLTQLGKQVSIEYKSESGWQPLARATADAQGRYRTSRTLTARRRPLRLTVRAFVAQDEYWPYLDGYSRTLAILIKP